MSYEFLPHTADVRLAVRAPSFETLLVEAARAIRDLVVGNSPVERRNEREVTCEGDTPEDLVLCVMREVLYLFASGFVPASLRVVDASPTAVRARVQGERFDPERHAAQPEVKAVTRHLFRVAQDESGWTAEVVFDL